jgi:hypothetical protein
MGTKQSAKQTTFFVSCVGQKLSTRAKAKNLYQSAWFLKARAYVETQQCPWFILSAKYGLIHPDDLIEPYEKTLNTMPRDARMGWAGKVFEQTLEWVALPAHITILAGKRYREYLMPSLITIGYIVDVPMDGLGIGEQLAWLIKNQSSTQLRLF